MAIKVKQPVAPAPAQTAAAAPATTAHGEALKQAVAENTTEISTTTTKAGAAEPLSHTHDMQVEPVLITPLHDQIEVGMSFKMPVASFTMLEFSVKRMVHCLPEEADQTYEDTKAWVETRLNTLIEAQQTDAA